MKTKELLALTPKLGDGALLTPQPSLESMVREYYARLVGPGEQAEIFTAAYVERIAAMGDADAGVRPTTTEAPKAEAVGGEAPETEAPRSERTAAGGGEARAEAPQAKPVNPFEVFEHIGLDLKIGDIDVLGGLKRSSQGESIAPLAAGLMGVVLTAIAKSESNRK